MKLILTRHGRTKGNESRINEGHLHGELSKEGKEQVKKLALRLKDEKIDVIYSSDLRRASDTAKEIAKYHPKTQVHFTKELREGSAGDFEGKGYDEVDWEHPPKNFESHEQIHKRVKKFADKIYRKHKNGTVLFVSHCFSNMALVAALFNESYKDMKKYRFNNTSVSIFEIKDGGQSQIHLLNCTKHLTNPDKVYY